MKTSILSWFILIVLLISSCTINHKDIIVIEMLDRFDNQEENEQLGMDLLFYNYGDFIRSEFPEFSQEVLNNINYQYFIQSDNKQLDFRLIVSNDALPFKDKIVDFFELTVNEQIEKQINDKLLFDQAVYLATESLKQLDSENIDSFWNNCSPIMKSMATKEGLAENFSNRYKLKSVCGERIFHSKQFYKVLANTDIKDVFVVNFTCTKDKNMRESLTLQLIDNELKILGYNPTYSKI